jgi:hypothetical protein
VTLRDVLVQIGFLMVTAGAMLAAWAIFTGQFTRRLPPPEELEVETEPPPKPMVRTRAPRPRTKAPAKKAAPRGRRPPA